MKASIRLVALGLAAVFGLASCATDPYYSGYAGRSGGGGYPSVDNAVPLIATGVAVAALAAYANERQSRKEAKYWNVYRNQPCYGYGGYCRPPRHRYW